MKMLKLAAVAGLCLAVAAVVCSTDASAAVTTAKSLIGHHSDLGFYAAQLVLATGLDNLRAQRAEWVRKAEAKIGEIADGMPAEQREVIETAHRELMTEIGQIDAAIATEQQRQANPPVPSNDAGVQAERQRLADLSQIATRGNIGQPVVQAAITAGTTVQQFRDMADIATRAQLDASVFERAVAGRVSVEAFRAEAFDVMAQRSNASRTSPANIQIGRDAAETRRAAMTDALVTRMAREGRRPGETLPEFPEHSRQYATMGLIEMAAEVIGHRGNIRNSRQIDDVMGRAMMATTDFPAIFQDAINRRLQSRYQAAMPLYRFIAARWTAADFRKANVVRAGDFPNLQEVSETGEIKSGTFSESKETIQVKPYGVKFSLSRQMIINDNLGAIDQMLGSYGDRVNSWEDGIVMALVVANPELLTDTTVVFEASKHKNYTSSGTAIDVASVGVGRAAMAKQVSLDKIELNLEPAILLTSPDKRTVAEQLLTAITPATTANAVPASMKQIKPLSSAKLTGNAWYLFADPNIAPCFMYALLDGYEGPRLTLEQIFGQQGIAVQLEHDFGAAAVDYRGGYKNAGA